ncbi:MAG: DEAD/DEAH box helicase, partial [Candidatus Woesebacteria bacterium]
MKLKSPVDELPLVGKVYSKRLKRLGITDVNDLITHIPSRYLDFRKVTKISEIKKDDVVTVKGKLKSIKNHFTRSRRFIQVAEVEDESGEMLSVWFNQTYLVKNLKDIKEIRLSGKIGRYGNKKAFISPEYEVAKGGRVHTARLVPIYPETSGVSSKWLRGRIDFALPKVIDEVGEFLPKSDLDKYGLFDMKQAIEKIHYPTDIKEAKDANKRFAFNELLFLHLISSKRKLDWQQNQATHKLEVERKKVAQFTDSLPFTLTKSQKRSIKEILGDLEKQTPMNRLLEGDVGSGKTVVAAAACFVSFINGYQSVIMAPTQILAQQHYTTLNKLFKKYKTKISLITSSSNKKDSGKADIFIGTHALIHKRVDFDNVAFVVIDEQHRFGVEQRAHLINTSGKRSLAPHVLTMTATPIPRTVVLTVHGDLSL